MSCSGWSCVKLGDVADVLSGYAFKTKDFVEEGIPVIKIKNIIPPTIDINDVQYVSEDLYRDKEKYSLKYDDILISMTGSNVNQIASAVGKIGRVKLKNTKLLLNQRVGKLYITDKEKCDYDFLYYYLIQPEVRYNLAASAGGSANQANINPNQIKDIDISLPSLQEQKQVAELLVTLDKKIELNNEMNKILEEMAQAIFKRWFVDFEFQDEQGKLYKSNGGEMVQSEMGMIPKGWRVGNLQEISQISAGGDKPKVTSEILTEECKIPIFSNGVSNDGLYGYTNVAKIFEESVTVSARGTIGFVCLRQQQFVPIVRLLTLVPKNEYISAKYLYLALKNMNIIGTGTTQQQVTVPAFKKTSALIPKLDVVQKFTRIVNPMFDKIKANREQNVSLKSMLNLLLPKLMNGEVRVNDIEANL